MTGLSSEGRFCFVKSPAKRPQKIKRTSPDARRTRRVRQPNELSRPHCRQAAADSERCLCVSFAALPRGVKRRADPCCLGNLPSPGVPDLPPRLPCLAATLNSPPPGKTPQAPAPRTIACPAIVSSKSPLLPGLAGTKNSPLNIQTSPPPHLTQRRPVVMPPPDRRRRLRHPGDLKGRTPLAPGPRCHANPRPAPGMTRPGPPAQRVLFSHTPISSLRRVRIMAR